MADSLYNLQLIQGFASDYLGGACFLSLEDLLYMPPALRVSVATGEERDRRRTSRCPAALKELVWLLTGTATWKGSASLLSHWGECPPLRVVWVLMWSRRGLALGTRAQPVLALMSLGHCLQPH